MAPLQSVRFRHGPRSFTARSRTRRAGEESGRARKTTSPRSGAFCVSTLPNSLLIDTYLVPEAPQGA
eukprot:2676962-Prymnesium_polylepis.1